MATAKRFKFSMTLVNELPATDETSASRETEYSDSACTGLRVIVNRKGIKRFLFRYNYQGKKRSMMIGELGAFDVKDARLKAYEFKRLLAEGLDPKTERDSKRAVATFYEFGEEHYLPYSMANKLSFRNDVSILKNYFYPLWRESKLNAIQTQEIQRFMDSLSGKLKPASINRMLSLIHRMLKLACEWGHLTTNPASHLKKLKENNQRTFFLSSEQTTRLLKSCDADGNQSAANFVRLALLTGMRAGEILNSKLEHLEFPDGEASLFLPHTKAGLARSVPLNESALAIIREQQLLMKPSNPYLFAGRFGDKPMSHPKKAFLRIKERAGDLDKLRIHDLRHSFASILINSGSASLYDVQHLLGHHSAQTTEKYAHLASGRLRDVSSHVSDFVANAVRVS
ncbi:integrase [Colwellia sp. PAMC 20917]|uniref:site-specific integrase n=1 Tax=Colwellia sp. PAMC 20917 TaxID=1816218 RepID=UPI0008786CEB|nr:site-specific integrase [Colwellia sp. PAMC 20917]AOW76773.1 integrase [Colwellia sp. PAMC 20917]